MKQKLSNILLYSALVLPLNAPNSWQVLSYKKIPANNVTFSDQGMNVAVNKSASPLIFPFKQAQMVSEVSVKGTVNGKVSFTKGQTQGGQKADDFGLRIGLVVAGKKRLNFAKKLIAPKWVKKLFSLAPKGTGVDHIYFLNATEQNPMLGKKRNHPLSELIKEDNRWLLSFDNQNKANFDFNAKINKPKKVLALWISVDGDDTQSIFNTNITELKIK